MERDWVADWLGLPYAALGRGPAYDCLGLFLALQAARHGRVLPDPRVDSSHPDIRSHLRTARAQWVPVDVPEEGDAVFFREGPQMRHIGYALDRRDMLHAHADVLGSTVERYTGLIWSSRFIGAYRFAA